MNADKRQTIRPAGRLSGVLSLPGDESISHRLAMIASLAEGTSRIANFSTGADCQSTLECVRGLGIEVTEEGTTLTVHGKGLRGWREPMGELDAGNSGATIRMMAGLLAGQPFTSRVFGDESVSRLPMGRVMEPLAEMRAKIEARDGEYPPLTIHGGELRPIDYTLPVASAQVKTCVLFAGMFAEGQTVVREPVRSRDHTEVALREFGADIRVKQRVITLEGRPTLGARDVVAPCDLSSAAFFLVAGLIVPDSNLVIQGVGLNPSRSAVLDFLLSMGADIQVTKIELANGEPMGDLRVRHSRVRGGVIEGGVTAALIDEIPVLAVLGAASEEGLVVRDAGAEDCRRLAENFGRMGIEIEVTPDEMRVPGRQKFRAARFDSFGDDRIAMALAVAALRGDGESVMEGTEAATVSFPEFWGILERAAGR
jgi:3-phosphoshikimate 1-carboxyvinyltransferase